MDIIQLPLTQPQPLTEDEQYLGKVITTDLNEIFQNRTVVFNAQCCPYQEMQAQARECIYVLEHIPCSQQVNRLLKKRLILELYTDLTSLSSCPKSACGNTRSAMLLDLQSIITSHDVPFIPDVFASCSNRDNTPSDTVKQATEGLAALVGDCLSTPRPEIQMHNVLTQKELINLSDVIKANNNNFVFSDLIKFYNDVLNHSLSTLYNVDIPTKAKAVIIYRIATQLYQEVFHQSFFIHDHLSNEETTALNTLKKRLLSLITPEWPPAPGKAKANDPTMLAPVMDSRTYESLYPSNNYNQDTLLSSTLPSTYNAVG